MPAWPFLHEEIQFVGVTVAVLLNAHQPEQLQENLSFPSLCDLDRVLSLNLGVYVVD